MLTLTENAQAAVKGLTQNSDQETAGLRISNQNDQLAVTVVPQPQPNDVVVDEGDARVYIAADTAPALEDQTLDAAQTADGIGFTLAQSV